MLGPGTAADYAKRRVRVLAVSVPRCQLNWNAGRCAPLSALLEGFEDASDWSVYDDASGIAADTTDPVSGTQRISLNKGTAGTGDGGLIKILDRPLDVTPWSKLRVVVGLPAADASKASKVRVYLDESLSFTDYSLWDLSGLQAGDNFLEIDLANPTATGGSPTLASVQRIAVVLYTTVATDGVTGWTVDDLRGLGTVTSPCYKTTATCQVTDIYANANALETVYFCSADAPPGTPGHALIVDWQETAGRLDPSKGLGQHGTIQIGLADPLHDDQGMDPYWSARAEHQGNQMAKFAERFLYLAGKTAIAYEGWTNTDGSAPQLSEMEARQYRIDRRPKSTSGALVLTLVDPLAVVEWSSSPEDVQGELRTAVSETATTWELDDAEQAAEYPTANFWVACEDEIAFCTSRSGTTMTIELVNGVRAQARTQPAAHASGEGVDLVDYFSGPVDTVLQGILNAAGLSDSLLDLTGWAAEVALFAPEYDLEVWVRKGTRRSLILQDFCEGLNIGVWWDPEAQLVKVRFGRPLAPGESYVELDDRVHTVADVPTTCTPQEDLQHTRIRVFFAVRDWSKDLRDGASYRRKRTYVNGDAESALQLGTQKLHEVWNYWMPRDLGEEAAANAYRQLARGSSAPDLVSAVVPSWIASKLTWGGLVRFTTTRRQNADGSPKVLECIVVRKQRRGNSELWTVEMLETTVFGRWWWWAADDALDYPGDIDSAHWANDAGQMSDGTPGYGLI